MVNQITYLKSYAQLIAASNQDNPWHMPDVVRLFIERCEWEEITEEEHSFSLTNEGYIPSRGEIISTLEDALGKSGNDLFNRVQGNPFKPAYYSQLESLLEDIMDEGNQDVPSLEEFFSN